MGVLVVSAAYPAPSEPTRGIFIENLCRELAALRGQAGEQRFDLAVVAPRIQRSDPSREVRAGIPVRRFPYPSGGRRLKERGGIPHLSLAAYLASGLAAVLAEVRRRRPSVIHSHWVLPAGVIGAMAGTVSGVAHVCHAHGSDVHRYGKTSRLARKLARWVLARSRLVLSVSGAISEELRGDYGVGGERIAELPMGIDGAVFAPGARAEARRALGLDERSPELLFAGDLLPEKGIDELATELLASPRPPYRLNVAGDGPLRPLLESLARRSPERLRLLGRLEPAELARWYRAADLLLLPSRGEGAPVTVMEALASGLPVVATAVGGVPGLVRQGREGWLAPAGAGGAEFLALVEGALFDPGRLESIRRALLSGNEDRTAARRARELAPLLEEVAGGPRQAA
jgi:glycosyltransferase involved in cell wall biosynthesis